MLFAALAASTLPLYAAAQSIHTIQVGQGGQRFDPNNVSGVQNNDIVQFVFDSPGHSVTQSTLANPCTPLDGGFSSGFSTSSGEVWNLTVSDASKPIWFFCAQNTPAIHCKNGMVGAINSGDDQLASYTAAAAAATNTPTASSVVESGSGAFATASIVSAEVVSGASDSGSATGTSTDSASPSDSSSAAMSFASFEGAGAALVAFLGAMLF